MRRSESERDGIPVALQGRVDNGQSSSGLLLYGLEDKSLGLVA